MTIDKPLTVLAEPGAEIRGSDIWTDWGPADGLWRSRETVPEFSARGRCQEGTERCRWPEQVFVDGDPLLQVATGSTPAAGEFALDAERRVVLVDDPTGREVEVTTRRFWFVPEADGITIEGFRMRHAANHPQQGAITDGGYSVWVRHSVMSDAHGAVISMIGRGGIVDNEIFNGGQLGIHHGGSLVQGNRVHGNNTEDFSTAWEAGGLKSVHGDMVIDGNEFFDNGGPGIWIDIRADNVTISNNRVHNNESIGIYYEISSGGRIFGNVVWMNSAARTSSWVTGAGILVHSSGSTEVYDNVVAWNGDGIGFQSQNRDDRPDDAFLNNTIRDNVIIQVGGRDRWGLAWAEDWDGPLFDPESNNRGGNNRYWFPTPEGEELRFGWQGGIALLEEFNATPGEDGGRYLTDAEKDELLTQLGVPLDPPD
ncbi:hypothetical protein BH23CHL7_BH23CHL7_06600 [soil metagenome]